jgi:hypothetical protein
VKWKAELYVDVPATAPFNGSLGIGNKYIHDALTAAGATVDVVLHPPENVGHNLIPMESACAVARLRGSAPPDLRLFIDRVLRTVGPDARSSTKNVVYFHGLVFGPSIYLQQSFTGFCLNSRYLMETLLTLLYFPCDDDRLSCKIAGSPVVGAVPMVAPCLDFPDGYPSYGRAHPLSERLETGNFLLGHALRPDKPDPFAFAAILTHLDRRCRKEGFEGAKAFLPETDCWRIAARAAGLPHRVEVDRLFHPMEVLQNPDLYRLIKSTAFGLCYDNFPEPFGIYPLDSVFLGVPVFTNGVGNLRHLLPADHGLDVFDRAEFYFGSPKSRFEAYDQVAERILKSVTSGRGRHDCAFGHDYIRENYSPDLFKQRMARFLTACRNFGEAKIISTEARKLRLSPAVRAWDVKDARVISDFKTTELSPEQNRFLNDHLGQSAELLTKDKDRKILLNLYRLGVVTLAPDAMDLIQIV